MFYGTLLALWELRKNCFLYGEVAERFKATVLKTVVSQGTVGSNPTLSAEKIRLHYYCQNLKIDMYLEAALEKTFKRL